jgi:hypothetical protein
MQNPFFLLRAKLKASKKKKKNPHSNDNAILISIAGQLIRTNLTFKDIITLKLQVGGM